ncbi:hypothetical protein VF14_30770 [Nostoc linckia z18]|jgi:dTDP-glucose pyrophosphorylase|uniref:Nucleotidyl transferase domain-containing protein n=2 Tax=Nostoc linckia TaxID=92942 RepID=A0A9Q6ELL1_NOSLI|nr:glycosyltransferase family 2 protein [Nostoc linckia]PHK38878.1 hypothetical protein VF12_16405 [Nostoc linckia z15]PHK44674.1 hypothetical protein VF13_20510 [Nostoc linckia z16]PHJ63515.1 hypothetical protein VF02_14760 [Nostoc linckia z1]PHJ68491.1 hypothetical protein VF05_15450 [Nostoc linckia z3]PHJ74261.1 hypothetical protein VF03_14590 [Nostoc linckia z2]
MNILLLMAGGSEAFQEAGYAYPKSLIEIEGLPLIQHVIQSLESLYTSNSKLICMVRREENRRSYIGSVIHLISPQAVVIEIEQSTSGAACTSLLAVEQIDTQEPLVIVNSDQIIETNLSVVLGEFRYKGFDGGIIVFEAVHPRWSYVRCNSQGLVIEAAEKRPISNLATAGFYYFAKGQDFVNSAKSMIKKDAHISGQFYVCPVYNEMLLKQAKIGVYKIPRSAYFSLATPQNLHTYEEYLRHKNTQPSYA